MWTEEWLSMKCTDQQAVKGIRNISVAISPDMFALLYNRQINSCTRCSPVAK